MPKQYKDYIHQAKEIFENLATATSVASAIVIALKIIGMITTTSSFLPLPLIGACLYLLSKIMPVGLKKLKKQILDKDIETMTETEIIELEELKSIIDDKCSTLRGTARSNIISEPITNASNTLPSVYIDVKGNEYIRKN